MTNVAAEISLWDRVWKARMAFLDWLKNALNTLLCCAVHFFDEMKLNKDSFVFKNKFIKIECTLKWLLNFLKMFSVSKLVREISKSANICIKNWALFKNCFISFLLKKVSLLLNFIFSLKHKSMIFSIYWHFHYYWWSNMKLQLFEIT